MISIRKSEITYAESEYKSECDKAEKDAQHKKEMIELDIETIASEVKKSTGGW